MNTHIKKKISVPISFLLSLLIISSSMVVVYGASTRPLVTDTMSSQEMTDLLYPVGAYYETSNTSFDPNTAWGGTWEKEEDGRVLIATSSSHTAGSTGGEETHVLTPGETALRSHTHTVNSHTHSIPAIGGSTSTNGNHQHSQSFQPSSNYGYAGSNGGFTSGGSRANGGAGSHSHTFTTGANTSGGSAPSTTSSTEANGTAHENMQPYLTVVRWHRTA